MEFKELPTSKRGKRDYKSTAYVEDAQALRDNPGQWAVIKDFGDKIANANAFAYSIRKEDGLRAFQGDEFQARTRGGEVYVRYVTPEILSAENEETE